MHSHWDNSSGEGIPNENANNRPTPLALGHFDSSDDEDQHRKTVSTISSTPESTPKSKTASSTSSATSTVGHMSHDVVAEGDDGSIFLTSTSSTRLHASFTTGVPSLLVAPSDSVSSSPSFSLVFDSSIMTLPSTALQTSSTSAPTFAPVKSHSSSTVQPTSSRPASTTSSLLPQPTSKTVPAKTVVGAVIGSVVGLVLVIALLLLCCICLRRRRHRRRYDADGRSISTTASSPDVSTSRSNSNGTTRFPNTQRRISMLSPLRHAPRLSRTANDARRPLTASTVQTGPSWATPTTTRHPFMHSAETTTPLIPPQAFIPPRDPRYPPSMATPSSSLPRLTPLQQYQTAPYFRRQESINKPTIQLVPSSATTAPIKRKPIPTSSFSQPRLPSRTNTTITSSSNPSDNQPRTHIRQFEPEPPLPPALRLLPPSTSTFPRSQQLFPSPFPGPLTNSTAMSSQTPVSQRPPPTASSSRYTPSTYSTNANANNRLSRVSHSGYSQSHYSRLSNATTFTSSQESFDTRTGERRMSDPFDFDRESVVRQ